MSDAIRRRLLEAIDQAAAASAAQGQRMDPAPIRAALKRIVAGMYGARGDTAEAIYDRDPGVASLLACVSHTGRF
jgi:hypothetical protein